MENNVKNFSIQDWYEKLLYTLEQLLMDSYQDDNTIKMQNLIEEVENSLDIITNENFLIFINSEIKKTLKNKHSENNNKMVFYMALTSILSHILNKENIKKQIISQETQNTIELYKNKIQELLILEVNNNREINDMNEDLNFYSWKLEEIINILLKYWIDWKNIKLEDVTKKFFDFWEITKILNIRFPNENITDEVLVTKVEKLSEWYQTMKILIDYLIRLGVIVRVNNSWYKIEQSILELLKSRKVIKNIEPNYNKETTVNTSINIIKSRELWEHNIKDYRLNDITQENELDKKKKEIEELKRKLIESERKNSQQETDINWLKSELESSNKNNKILSKQIKALKKELKTKWKSKEEIKRAIEIYKENN